MKYDVILSNTCGTKSKINWIKEKNNNSRAHIQLQSEMCLSEHKIMKSQNITIEWKKAICVKAVTYSMSEDQLKKSSKLSWQKNLKRIHTQSLKSSAEYFCSFQKKKDEKWLCVDYRQLNNITRWNLFSALIEGLQD